MGRVLERDLEVVAEIVAGAAAAAPAAPAPAAEEPLEEIAEQVLQPAEVHPARRQVDAAVAVVLGAASGIREDRVGLVDRLEPLLGLVVARVPVGMVLERELPEGLLDLAFARVPRDAEELVVVALGHGYREGIAAPVTGSRR